MSSKKPIMKYTEDCCRSINKLRKEIEKAEAIIIGAGAGLSESAGLTYSGKRFIRYFSDFQQKYGISDMYMGGFYPYDTLEEYWAWWSRHIFVNRYDIAAGQPYLNLLELMKKKEYFVITTNVDHQFQFTGFNKNNLFYTQGDYGLWQCSKPCHHKTYDNEKAVRKMIAEQDEMKIPNELIPRCPVCGAPMTMNLRCDQTFVQDEGWFAAKDRYKAFLHKHEASRLLFLELGVGGNTPAIIKYPFWQMTARSLKARYASINLGEASCPEEIRMQSICIDCDIGDALQELLSN